nr:hypothetical protein [Tanacetum cinerariifolium]
MILNTLDHLGKFDATGDEENKLIEKGTGPNWLFDIDTLTNSMNYVPVVVAGTSSTNISDTKDVASQAVKKDVSSLRYIAFPNWFHEAHMETSNAIIRNRDASDDCNADVPESSGISNLTATSKVPSADQVEPAVSLPVESKILVVCLDISPESSSGPRLISKGDLSQKEAPFLGNALTLSNRFEDTFRVEADLSNMETSIPVGPTLTFRIHKDHPKSQIIGPVDTPVQTRHKSKNIEEQTFIATIHQKINPDLLQFYLFSCFLSQEEPKKIFDALKDPSWVEVMQEELLQFKIKNVWVLVDYPKGMDVKSTFLYGTIDEEVYVMQPPGFHDPEFPKIVYKVEKAMYGLHQAPRAWYDVRSANTPMDKENHWGKDGPGHPKLGLWYPKESPFDLVAYSDSDYGDATQDRKSTIGGCQFLGRREVPILSCEYWNARSLKLLVSLFVQ